MGRIAKGLVSIGALMAMIITTSKLLSSNSSAIVKGSGSLILFATSLVILTKAVEKLGGMDIASIGKGLLGIGALMAQIVIFMKVSNMDKMGVKTGVESSISTSLVIFAEAVKRFAAIDTSALIKGLLGVAAVLAQIVIFVNLTGNSKNVLSTAIGLTVLGAAMLIFAKAIENMGSMSWEQIGKGLLTLGASLGVVILAMQGMKGALPGAAALLVVAGALAIFAPVLKSFGSMSLEQIAKGLLTLSGVFAIFAIAGLVLAPIIPVLLGVGAAIALLGIGIAAAGAGLLAFSAGLAALAISGSAGAAALVVILTSVISLIPMVFQEIEEVL